MDGWIDIYLHQVSLCCITVTRFAGCASSPTSCSTTCTSWDIDACKACSGQGSSSTCTWYTCSAIDACKAFDANGWKSPEACYANGSRRACSYGCLFSSCKAWAICNSKAQSPRCVLSSLVGFTFFLPTCLKGNGKHKHVLKYFRLNHILASEAVHPPAPAVAPLPHAFGHPCGLQSIRPASSTGSLQGVLVKTQATPLQPEFCRYLCFFMWMMLILFTVVAFASDCGDATILLLVHDVLHVHIFLPGFCLVCQHIVCVFSHACQCFCLIHHVMINSPGSCRTTNNAI